jgi:UDP-N-acetylglucosamine acyltransferase
MTQIHPSAIIHKDAQLAKDVEVGPNCTIASGVIIGTGTKLDANVVIGKDVKIGTGNRFFPNCVMGGSPQILGLNEDTKVGKLVIGDNNTFREQVTVHPSIYPDGITEVGNDNLLMIGVHIGHDCILEDKIVLSNYVQISGHCKIGTGVWFSGMVLLHQFITVGKWCYASGLAGINHDIPPFLIVSGHYPPVVRGVNKRGMLRAGLNEHQQHEVFEAYKRLYRQNDGTLLSRAEALASEEGIDENVKEMTDMIIKSHEHRFGRYLEKFRH